MWKTRASTLALVPVILIGLGVVTASAATLGGTNSAVLGADRVEVASCDEDGVTLSYLTSYDPAHAQYGVTGVALSGVSPACEAHAYKLTLSSGDSVLSDSEGTVHLEGTTAKLDTGSFVSAAELTNVALTLSN